jgi:hypothetical protein
VLPACSGSASAPVAQSGRQLADRQERPDGDARIDRITVLAWIDDVQVIE